MDEERAENENLHIAAESDEHQNEEADDSNLNENKSEIKALQKKFEELSVTKSRLARINQLMDELQQAESDMDTNTSSQELGHTVAHVTQSSNDTEYIKNDDATIDDRQIHSSKIRYELETDLSDQDKTLRHLQEEHERLIALKNQLFSLRGGEKVVEETTTGTISEQENLPAACGSTNLDNKTDPKIGGIDCYNRNPPNVNLRPQTLISGSTSKIDQACYHHDYVPRRGSVAFTDCPEFSSMANNRRASLDLPLSVCNSVTIDQQYQELQKHTDSIKSIVQQLMREQQQQHMMNMNINQTPSVQQIPSMTPTTGCPIHSSPSGQRGYPSATSCLCQIPQQPFALPSSMLAPLQHACSQQSLFFDNTSASLLAQQQQQQQQQQLMLSLLSCQQQLQMQQMEMRHLNQLCQEMFVDFRKSLENTTNITHTNTNTNTNNNNSSCKTSYGANSCGGGTTSGGGGAHHHHFPQNHNQQNQIQYTRSRNASFASPLTHNNESLHVHPDPSTTSEMIKSILASIQQLQIQQQDHQQQQILASDETVGSRSGSNKPSTFSLVKHHQDQQKMSNTDHGQHSSHQKQQQQQSRTYNNNNHQLAISNLKPPSNKTYHDSQVQTCLNDDNTQFMDVALSKKQMQPYNVTDNFSQGHQKNIELKKAIYEEISALLMQQEQQLEQQNSGEFLLELFKELRHSLMMTSSLQPVDQSGSSKFNHVLMAIKDLINRYLIENCNINSTGFENNNRQEIQTGHDKHKPFAKSTDQGTDQSLKSSKSTEKKQNRNNNSLNVLKSNTKNRDAYKSKQINDEIVKKVVYNTNANMDDLEEQIKNVVDELRPVLRSKGDSICSAQVSHDLRQIIISSTTARCLPIIGSSLKTTFFKRQLSTILDDTLNKFQEQKLRDCGEELLSDISDVVFNELSFFRLMQNIGNSSIKAPTDETKVPLIDQPTIDESALKTVKSRDENANSLISFDSYVDWKPEKTNQENNARSPNPAGPLTEVTSASDDGIEEIMDDNNYDLNSTNSSSSESISMHTAALNDSSSNLPKTLMAQELPLNVEPRKEAPLVPNDAENLHESTTNVNDEGKPTDENGQPLVPLADSRGTTPPEDLLLDIDDDSDNDNAIDDVTSDVAIAEHADNDIPYESTGQISPKDSSDHVSSDQLSLK